MYDLIVIGSGAAGLSAALYAGRYRMKTLVIEGELGGETATAGMIENYPGVEAIDGFQLIQTMKKQAIVSGAEIKKGWAEKIEKEGNCFVVSVKDEQFHANTVIITIGSKRRHLGLAREGELTGKGVHYCVTCDGPLYGGKTIAMVGGGDSSVKGVNFLAEYAEKIYFITMEDALHAEPVNLEHMKRLGDKVEVITNTQITDLMGDKMLEQIKLSKSYKNSDELSVEALFIEIGFDPDKTFAEQLGLETDPKGYTKVDNHMQTNVPGVFAAGDATTHFGSFKQDITAASLGAVAATSAYEYHNAHKEFCQHQEKVSSIS